MKKAIKVMLLVLCVVLIVGVVAGCEKRYTVTYYNGDEVVNTQKVKAGETVSAPDDPTKDGYIFDNWYTDKGMTQKYDFNTKVNQNTALYAKFVTPTANK